MKILIFILLLCSVVLINFSCVRQIRVTAPERVPFLPPESVIPNSSTKVNVTISNKDLIDFIKSEIKNPIIADDNPLHVKASILAIETVTTRELVQSLVSPFVPGKWIDVQKRTFQTVREAFSCALKPWKWGTCWKDVVKEVWVWIKVWIEPQAAVFAWVTQEVTRLLDKIYKVQVTIHYPTELEDAQVQFTGNNFEITTKYNTNLRFDYEQAVVPLGPTLKLTSVLNTNVHNTIKIFGTLTIQEPGNLIVSVDQGKTIVELGILPANLPILEDIILSEALTGLFLPIGKIMEKLSEKVVNKAIISALDKNSEKLNFRESIDLLTQKFGEPKNITDNVWLNINPVSIKAGQLNGLGHSLNFTTGLEFRPVIEFNPTYPSINPNKVPFIVDNDISDSSFIFIKAQAPLRLLEDTLKATLNEVIDNSGNNLLKKVRVDKISLFNTVGSNIAIQVRFLRKGVFKRYYFLCNAYITAKLSYNEFQGRFFLADVKFTLDTKNALANSVLNPIIDDAVERIITQKSELSISDNVRIANAAVKNANLEFPYGRLRMNFSPIGIVTPFLTDSTFESGVNLKGKIDFELLFFNSLYSNSFTIDQISVEGGYKTKNESITDTENYSLNRTKTVVSTDLVDAKRDRKLLVLTEKSKDNFSDFDEIRDPSYLNVNMASFNKNALQDSLTNFTVKIGQLIYVEENGRNIIRPAKFEDTVIKGDEVLISPIPGIIVRSKEKR
jgi:hypothetical protein